VHDTPFYDVQTEGTLTDREPERTTDGRDILVEVTQCARSSAASLATDDIDFTIPRGRSSR
jgi:hypothetical protein